MNDKPPKRPQSPKGKVKTPVPITQGWKLQLDRYDSGKIKPTFLNAAAAIRRHPEWQGVLAYDEFALKIVLRKPTPWAYHAEWDDDQEEETSHWLQEQDINVLPNIARLAVRKIAREHRYNPVRDYLCSLKHDSTKRVDKWLTTYLGVRDNLYTQGIGTKWLISAVARALKPGCKADCVLVLEAPQGKKKSSAFEILGQPWFTDDLEDLGTKDSKQVVTSGVWIIELSELDSMSRSDSPKIKAFISRRIDKFRPAYGHNVIERPRQTILCGTTNDSTPLKDWTGNRRFWFARPRNINLSTLSRDRDQLWAEAVALYHQGVSWWIDEEKEPKLAAMAETEQGEHLQEHPWKSPVELWLDDKKYVTIEQIRAHLMLIGTVRGTWGQAEANHIAHILQSLGWKRTRKTVEGIDSKYKYYLPGDQEEEEDEPTPF